MFLFQLLKGNSQNKIPKSNPAPQTALNDEDEESEDELFAESGTAVWYTDNEKSLKRALELWDGLYGQDDSARKAYKEVLDVGVTLEYMQIMAAIFKLMQVIVSLGTAPRMFEFFVTAFPCNLSSACTLPSSLCCLMDCGWFCIDFQCDFAQEPSEFFLCALYVHYIMQGVVAQWQGSEPSVRNVAFSYPTLAST